MTSPNRSLRQRLETLPTWALMVLCAVYVVSPVDLIPFCPIDDLAVFGWTIFTIVKRLAAGPGTLPGTGPDSTGTNAASV